ALARLGASAGSGDRLRGRIRRRLPSPDGLHRGQASDGTGIRRADHTQRCGCGLPLRECDFWTAVRRPAGGARLLEASEFFGLGALARWRHLPLTFVYGRRRRLESLYGEHWRGCERLYRGITETTGCEVVVDSSKAVPYLRMLSSCQGSKSTWSMWSAMRARWHTRGSA